MRLTLEEIEWLCEDKARADFFEHTLMELGIETHHDVRGCHLCAR